MESSPDISFRFLGLFSKKHGLLTMTSCKPYSIQHRNLYSEEKSSRRVCHIKQHMARRTSPMDPSFALPIHTGLGTTQFRILEIPDIRKHKPGPHRRRALRMRQSNGPCFGKRTLNETGFHAQRLQLTTQEERYTYTNVIGKFVDRSQYRSRSPSAWIL